METIQMLGSLGEFVGAIGVVATLVYLTIQVRHSKEAMEANTRSMEESRRLAMAQAYQTRATDSERGLQLLAESRYQPPIMLKYQAGGRDALTAEEQFRMSRMQLGFRTRVDNLHYQFQMGFLDQQYYESAVIGLIRNFAPVWADFGLVTNLRPPFQAEVERILAATEEQS
jgi:hypothetical protein